MTSKNQFLKAAMLSTALGMALTPSFAAADHNTTPYNTCARTGYCVGTGMSPTEINRQNRLNRQHDTGKVPYQYERGSGHDKQYEEHGEKHNGNGYGNRNHGGGYNDRTIDNIQRGINIGIDIFRNNR